MWRLGNEGLILLSLFAYQCSLIEHTEAGKVEAADDGSNYQKTCEKINKYLETIHTGSMKSNMDELEKWLDKLTTKKGLHVFKDKKLVEALKQILELRTIVGGDDNTKRCNKYSYDILVKNQNAVGNRVHMLKNRLTYDRKLDRTVHHYTLEHALYCLKVYPQMFKSKQEKLDQELLKRVSVASNIIINWGGRQDDNMLNYLRYNMHKNEIEPNESQRALQALKLVAKDDDDAKYLDKSAAGEVRKDKVKELYQKYVVDSCRYYVKEIGRELYLSAEYDDRVLLDDHILHQDLVDAGVSSHDTAIRFGEHASADKTVKGDNLEFYLGMIHFRVCELIIRQEDSLFEKVVSLI